MHSIFSIIHVQLILEFRDSKTQNENCKTRLEVRKQNQEEKNGTVYVQTIKKS